MSLLAESYRVLVAEPIADAGVDLLRERFAVDVETGWSADELAARIAHTGYFGAFDIVVSLAGLEMTLAQLGHQVELGAGPGAAQQVFLEAGVAPTPA